MPASAMNIAWLFSMAIVVFAHEISHGLQTSLDLRTDRVKMKKQPFFRIFVPQHRA